MLSLISPCASALSHLDLPSSSSSWLPSEVDLTVNLTLRR